MQQFVLFVGCAKRRIPPIIGPSEGNGYEGRRANLHSKSSRYKGTLTGYCCMTTKATYWY